MQIADARCALVYHSLTPHLLPSLWLREVEAQREEKNDPRYLMRMERSLDGSLFLGDAVGSAVSCTWASDCL